MRVVTVAGDPEREAALAARLEQRSDVELVLRCVDRVEALGALRGGSLDAVIVVGDPVWFDEQCGDEAAAHDTMLVALAPDPLTAERMRRLGAALLEFDATERDVIEACRSEVVTVRRPPEDVGARGSLVALWGPKGAPGRSTIGVELATELAMLEPRTLLIDADTNGGDLMQIMGVLDEMSTIVWAARLAAKGELADAALNGGLRRIGQRGPLLLPGIPRSDLWPEISDHGWKQLLLQVRQAFRFVVCDVAFSLEAEPSQFPDGGEGRNRLARATLRAADHVVAVVRADPVGIKNFLWAYEQLKELVDEESILVVANRVRSGDEREVSDVVKRYVRKRPVALVPDEPGRFADALADGRSVRAARPGSEVAAAIRTIASALGGSSPRRGFLTRLGGRA